MPEHVPPNNNEAKVTIGYELPAERWNQAAKNLQAATPLLAQALQKINYEGAGEQDAEDFIDDMLLAVMAL